MNPYAELSRRAAAALNTVWWRDHVSFDVGERFVAAVDGALEGYPALAPQWQALILQAEGKDDEANAVLRAGRGTRQ